jgi:hypothetical protein
MNPSFEKCVESIRDEGRPVGERLFLVSREIVATQLANAFLREAGDTHGVTFGEEYLTKLKHLHDRLRQHAVKRAV